MSRIPTRCIETGGGVAVWEAEIPQEPRIGFVSESDAATPDAPTFKTVTLYRPVRVDINDDGEAYAYYYGSNLPFEQLLKTKGKVYVDPRYVHATPRPNSHRASRFGVQGPGDKIDLGDVPDEFRE
jgi:hypothetical protein